MVEANLPGTTWTQSHLNSVLTEPQGKLAVLAHMTFEPLEQFHGINNSFLCFEFLD